MLIVEDEFLIAMDVEQTCRDNGARDVSIFGGIADLGADPFAEFDFDAAIIDLMADGTSTLDFARKLQSRGIPFVFATGYSDRDDIFGDFQGVKVVGKPFAGDELIQALVDAIGARPVSSGGV